jgi:hypothetical protein
MRGRDFSRRDIEASPIHSPVDIHQRPLFASFWTCLPVGALGSGELERDEDIFGE